jgi:tagatose-1,6-bisphosphate aldolase
MGAPGRRAVTGSSLSGISDDDGRFSILAIDHRDSLRQFLSPADPDSLAAADITALKIELVGGVADLATGVMLEPEYSIPQVLDAGALPPGVGFLAALESQGYLADPSASPTTILDGWSIAQAKGCGAAAAKLLLPYHPERPLAAAQEAVAEQVLASCRAAGLPLALEPLFYDLDAPADRARVVVATARRFAAMQPDLLKLPYPGSAGACDEITSIATMPWAMLSGGGTFEDFRDQYAIAAAAGCSGFMVGRALWGEAARAASHERAAIIEGLVRPRFEQLVAIDATTT